MRRAVILAGTGAIGWATARRLAPEGWEVVVTGRDPAHAPPGLAALGVALVRADRHDVGSVAAVIGRGADLLVDCACFTAAHAAGLSAHLG
ncbi:MAG: reductase, partial [Acidimicrobiales bacterium]